MNGGYLESNHEWEVLWMPLVMMLNAHCRLCDLRTCTFNEKYLIEEEGGIVVKHCNEDSYPWKKG